MNRKDLIKACKEALNPSELNETLFAGRGTYRPQTDIWVYPTWIADGQGVVMVINLGTTNPYIVPFRTKRVTVVSCAQSVRVRVARRRLKRDAQVKIRGAAKDVRITAVNGRATIIVDLL